jgi:hypothetical protein
MKQLIIVALIGMFITSAFGTAAYRAPSQPSQLDISLCFSNLQLNQYDTGTTLTLDGTNTYNRQPNEPVLPCYRNTYIFPVGTVIQRVTVQVTQPIQRIPISQPLLIAPEALPPDYTSSNWNAQSSNDQPTTIFPSSWYDYSISRGLDKGTAVTLLTIQYYPIRYYDHTLFYTPEVTIHVTYKQPAIPLTTAAFHGLLIISPAEFSDLLQPFVAHKIALRLPTRLVTLEEIYDGTYFPTEGRDEAEQVKYFIKNALDDWGITYVLLVGGRKPGLTESWYTPVRYVHVVWDEEQQFVSDLYFADIYDGAGNFSSWDTDDNNVFSDWPSMGPLRDELDLYPDVYLGRWPCRNKAELKIIIAKTMRYETMQTTKKVVVVGGDNFEDPGIEGEIVGNKTLTLLPDLEPAKVYATEMAVNSDNMKEALGDGALFMHFHGHGSPIKWGTHSPENFDEWEDGLYIADIPWFFNKEYPIAVFGGCHTAMFNVSMINRPWIYTWRPTPEGLSWWFARKIGGGSIASLGYTCFPVASPGEYGDLDGDGVNEPDCVESGYGYMQLQFFAGYGIENLSHLGECWGYAQQKYLDTYKLPYTIWHLHTSQGFVLLGDPSLCIGGYS